MPIFTSQRARLEGGVSNESNVPGTTGPREDNSPIPSRNTKTTASFCEKIGALSQAVTVVLGVFVVGFTFIEWKGQKDIRRIERTLTYIDRFEDPGGVLSNQRRTIQAFFRSAEQNFDDLSSRLASTVPEMHSTVLGNFMRKATAQFETDGTELLNAVDDVIFHLDSVDLCICSEACDSEVGVQGFGDFASSTAWWFGWHISERRKHASQYGLGLEKIAQTYASRSDQACNGAECVSWDLNGNFRCKYDDD